MTNPRHRPKHMQNKSWFYITINNEEKIVRPVDGEQYFNEISIIAGGIVYLVDENLNLIATMDALLFDKNARRV